MNSMQACIDIATIFKRPLVLVDIETTGLSPRNSEMIEVAAIRIEDGKIVHTFSELLQPRHHVISPTITRITGITREDVAGKPFFSDKAEELGMLFNDGAIFIAHNVQFDYSFIQQAYDDIDIAFTPTLFDTVRLSRSLYKQERKHSLGAIIKYHNIPVQNRHRAYADALAMWKFMQIAVTEKGKDSFAETVNAQLI